MSAGQADAQPVPDGALPSFGMTSREHVTALPADPGSPVPVEAPPVPAKPDTGPLADLAGLATSHRDWLILGGLALTVLILAAVVRRAVKGGRPDRWLDTFAVAVGFGWSVEGMWEVSGRLGLSLAFAVVAVVVFDSMMASSMLRAYMHQKEYGTPGRHASAMWTKAAIAGGIVAFASDQFFEVPLRLAIPLLVVYQFWLGLKADGPAKAEGVSSWRWTPRRLLLALGAIEPGERDVATVHRAARVKQMTELEFRRRSGGPAWLTARRTSKLSRLSLSADDGMIAEVEANVLRAGWFLRPDTDDAPGETPQSHPGADPGDVPGTDPGGTPGVDPGGNVGIDPGDPPGVEAGTDAGVGVGVDPPTARVPTRVRPPSPKQVKALKLRTQHPDMPAAEIARKVSADYKTVRGWLAKAAEPTPDLPVAPPAGPVLAGVNGRAFHPSTTPKETPDGHH